MWGRTHVYARVYRPERGAKEEDTLLIFVFLLLKLNYCRYRRVVLLYDNNRTEMLNRRAFSRAVHVTSGYTSKHTHRLIMLFCHPHAPMVSVCIRVRLLLPFRVRILRIYPVRTMLSL